MTLSDNDIEEAWQKLTSLLSYTGPVTGPDDPNHLKVISRDQLFQIMHELPPSQLVNTANHPTPEAAAIRVAAEYFNVDDNEIIGQSRRSHMSMARKMACLLMRDIGQMSYDSIGHKLNRDHTTILYLVRSAQEAIDHRPNIKMAYVTMRNALQRFVNQMHNETQEEEEEGQWPTSSDS